MKVYNNLLLYLLLFYHIHVNLAHVIDVYSNHNKEGTKVEISTSKCSNLPEGMAGELTSVNTNGRCARFFDGWNCSGKSIEILPNSPSHNNLGPWEFNDKALSVGPCRNPCSIDVTGVIPQETLQIEIFSRQDFKGAYESIKVDGCTPIPTFFINRLLSIKTNDHCLQFYSNIDCAENKGRSIELRPRTPFHNDISHWWLPEARALSHCGYKCNNSLSTQISRAQISPGRGEVILFDEKEFKGNWLTINLGDGHCINITRREWEGTAVSIKVDTQTCVVLYDRRGCTGGSHVVTTSQDLSERKFDVLTRSLQLWACGNQGPPHPTSPKIDTTPGGNSKHLNRSHTPGYTKQQEPRNEGHSSFSPVLVIGIAVPILGVLLSVLLVFFLMKRCHPYKNIMEMISEKEIQEFLSGLGMEIESNQSTAANDDYSTELLAQNRPYNEAYEISRSQIKFDTKVPLGMGEFGVVYKGTLVLNKESDIVSGSDLQTIPVAIKTVKPNTNAQYLRSLLKEVKVMLYIGKHSNVIHMVGCCTENIRKGEILVLMDYCEKGSLESFLQKNRTYFKNIVEEGKIRVGTEIKEDQCSSMQNYKNLDVFTCLPFFDFFQLLNWCIEVARGMEFLALSKVVHADLAARNVLLDQEFHAKISDFGLSRQLYCYSEYVKKRREPLPWRWLAIESLKSLEFSSNSDVWSYGVLCWEIFTLGEKPYPGVVWSDAFLSNLEEGLRLPKPKYVTTELYNLMIRCWEENPGNRPSFTEILEEIQESSALHQYSNHSNPVLIT